MNINSKLKHEKQISFIQILNFFQIASYQVILIKIFRKFTMSEPNCSKTVALVENQLDQPSQIHKVNVDCWEMILDLLSIKDIFSMSKTCKRMRQMCGYYLSEFLPATCSLGRDVTYPNHFGNDFNQFVRRILIELCDDNFEHTLNIESYCSLKTIIVSGSVLTDTFIDKIKGVLKIVENIELRQCTFHDDIHEKLFEFCPKLKQLSVEEHYSNPPERNLFQKIFPSLEYFEYIHCPRYGDSNEIHTFLERHPNVKHFGIDLRQLWANRTSFINSNVQLDCLEVNYQNVENPRIDQSDDWPSKQQFVNLLQSLYRRGFYKTLSIMHFDYNAHHKELIEEMATLYALESFTTNQEIDLSQLVHLKELCICWDFTFHLPNIESLATNLVNLERLVIHIASTDEILPFFRHSKRLKTVRVIALDGPLIENGALNLVALNMERNKLGATKRVIICVKEKIYLATRMKKMFSNLNLVEIARLESEPLKQTEEYF